MKDYATYKNQTDKIAKTGKILAFSGFVVGGTTLALNNELKPELKLLLGIPAGASFMTGLLLISIAQTRYQKMMHNNVSDIHKIVSGLNQQVKTRE
ncbi:MAG: hypothetical protein IJU89_00475 [Alphaproteobacteria bacterium]|nr:hypothetical protein [Alphaproteobacteria bacterium]